MGAWGAGIFDNDCALDIKQDYQALLAFDTPEEEAYQLVKQTYLEDVDDVDFWFTMATIQQKYGILMPEVTENTLRCITSGLDELDWKGADKQTLKAREKVRNDLKEKLLAPPLPKRKVPKPRIQKPRWQIGDVIVSQIVCPTFKDKWYYNKYVLYRVVQLDRYSISSLKPDLAYSEHAYGALYNWIGDDVPDPSILNTLSYHRNPGWENKMLLIGLSWIPRLERFALFQHDCASPMPPDNDIILYGAGSNIFSMLSAFGADFKMLYEKFK